MKMLRPIVLTVFVTSLVFSAVSFAADKTDVSNKPAMEQKTESVKQTKTPSAQEKQDYTKAIREELNELSAKIDDLKARGKELKGEALKKINAAIEVLKEKQAAAAKKLDELSAASQDKWKEFQKGLNEAVTDLKKAYNDAASHF